MSNLLPALGCVQTRSGGGFLTCRRLVTQSQLRKNHLAKLAAHNEYGEQYDKRHRRASVSRFAPI